MQVGILPPDDDDDIVRAQERARESVRAGVEEVKQEIAKLVDLIQGEGCNAYLSGKPDDEYVDSDQFEDEWLVGALEVLREGWPDEEEAEK